MKFKIDMSKNTYKIIFLLVVLLGSFCVFLVARAGTGDNKIAIRYIHMTGITTGSSFDSSDGLDYTSGEKLYADSGYTPGNDARPDNRIVRSFDTLTYNFHYELIGKNPGDEYTSERTLLITVKLSEEEAKYVSFGKNDAPGVTEKTFAFKNKYAVYGTDYNDSITLYVLGAPNGFDIDPSFEIKESTNTEVNYNVTLGKATESGTGHYYDYDSEASTKYSVRAETNEFHNYMPTKVSSKTGNVVVDLFAQNDEGQKTTYDNKIGRYLTFVVGLKIQGDGSKGIKGLTMPVDGITLPISFSQTGAGNNTPVTKNNWGRLYGSEKVDDIESILVTQPYSNQNEQAIKRTSVPGDVTYTGSELSISNYAVTYAEAEKAADDTVLSAANHYFGTYAISVFSPRTSEDGNEDLNVTMNTGSTTVKDSANNDLTITAKSAQKTNLFYEIIDYSLKGEFYDQSGNKLSTHDSEIGNGNGSLSKGSSFIFKTTFNYKKTLSNQGLKEIIKVDTDAFRVVAVEGEKNYRIKITGDDKLTEDDFEVKFVTGSWNNANYTASANSERLSPGNAALLGGCPTNIGVLTPDQIQNIYGSPCIIANEGVENTYESVFKAKISSGEGEEAIETEDPITKVIIQTKEGVKLPDSVVVTIDIGLRVRNMLSDFSTSHQATAVAMTSDYDEELLYYAPRMLGGDDTNSITNPNNYKKTVYNGNDVIDIDNSHPWGDSLKVVNFTSRQDVTVTNTNTDGTIKTEYSVSENETLKYKISTTIQDNNMEVGADDVWYIDHLFIKVFVPNTLTYVYDPDLGTPVVENLADGSGIILTYEMPYTKPNQKIKDIYFKANLVPTISGTKVPITVTSYVEAININGEQDYSYFGRLSGAFTIYATEVSNIIPMQEIGSQGSVIEKNEEFSYILKAFNNTLYDVTDYSIVDILPTNGKDNSKFDGNYKVKVTLPASLNTAKVLCSKQNYKDLTLEVNNNKNIFEECNITEDYVDATAIKITDIPINHKSYMEGITVSIKPTKNKYSNVYANKFVSQAAGFVKMISNEIDIRVISRTISGRVFVDMDEDGIEEDGDQYLEKIPVSLYRYADEKLTKVADTDTNKKGEYKFKDLDSGTYRVRINYSSALYDVTIRYGTEDVVHDSDAYKITQQNAEGETEIAEISYVRTIDDKDTMKDSLSLLRVTRDNESVENLNLGLISRKVFGFEISKYITKLDLVTTAGNETRTYNNEKKVKLDVKNSLQATGTVYYGFKITNDSTSAGYVKVVDEDIPAGTDANPGLTFDASNPYNSQWIDVGGNRLQSIALENDLIKPGETRYLQLALNMPRQAATSTYINTVTIAEIEEYIPEKLTADKDRDAKENYEIGNSVKYGGINWHVVNVAGESGDQVLTLLADNMGISKAHVSNGTTYKWSDSLINTYLNSEERNAAGTSTTGKIDKAKSWIGATNLNRGILIDNSVCDDASGLPVASNGGTLQGSADCQSNLFKNVRVRLLTASELTNLVTVISRDSNDYGWLTSGGNFWLMDADNSTPTSYDAYGVPTNPARLNAKYAYTSAIPNTEGLVRTATANTLLNVRPVITISSKNIIPE